MVKALVESEEEVRKAERVEEKGASSIGPFCYWNKRKLLVSIFVDDGAQWPNRGGQSSFCTMGYKGGVSPKTYN